MTPERALSHRGCQRRGPRGVRLDRGRQRGAHPTDGRTVRRLDGADSGGRPSL